MNCFRVRVDGLMDDRVSGFLKKFCKRYLLVHHTTETENPHYHAYVETKMDAPNFSKYIKKHLEVKGADYSNKICDPTRVQEFLSYLFNKKKGNVPRYVSSEDFTEYDVVLAKSQAAQIDLEFNERKKRGKASQYQMVQEAIANLQREKRTLNPSSIYDEIVYLSEQYKKVVRVNQLRDMINSVMMWSGDKPCQDYVRNAFLQQYGDFGQNNSSIQ